MMKQEIPVTYTQKNNELATLKMTGKLNRREIVFFNEAYRIRDKKTNKSVFYVSEIISEYKLHPKKTYNDLKNFCSELAVKSVFEYIEEDEENKTYLITPISFFESIFYEKGVLTFNWSKKKIPQEFLETDNKKFFQISVTLMNKFKNINTIKFIRLLKTKISNDWKNKTLKIEIKLLNEIFNNSKKTTTKNLKAALNKMLLEINSEPLTFLNVSFAVKQKPAQGYFVFNVDHKTNKYGKNQLKNKIVETSKNSVTKQKNMHFQEIINTPKPSPKIKINQKEQFSSVPSSYKKTLLESTDVSPAPENDWEQTQILTDALSNDSTREKQVKFLDELKEIAKQDPKKFKRIKAKAHRIKENE